VVLLDVIARDRQGRLVPDLRPDELQVFENGKRCDIRSFRRVHPATEAKPGASPATAPATPVPTTEPPAPASAPSRANLVVLLFQTLYDEQAASVRTAALDLVDRSFPPGTWFAVYKTDVHGTRLLQPFTNAGGQPLRRAVLRATASSADRRTGSDAGRPSDDGPDPVAVDPGNAAAAALQSLNAKDLAESSKEAEEAHFRGREELATFLGIQAIVRSISGMPGRKAVLYFAADAELGNAMISGGGGEVSGGRASLAFAKAMSDANRANVTVHTVDARGLQCAKVGGRSTFDQTCGGGAAGGTRGGLVSSTSWAAATEKDTDQGPLLGDPERLPGILRPTAPQNFLSIHSGSLLEHVAEATGGLAIRNTNDLAAGLERVTDELSQYYEVVYAPPNPVRDGRFRSIQAKATRPGVHVRTRAGYFATPAAAAPSSTLGEPANRAAPAGASGASGARP
jgi:VWFA-related protein